VRGFQLLLKKMVSLLCQVPYIKDMIDHSGLRHDLSRAFVLLLFAALDHLFLTQTDRRRRRLGFMVVLCDSLRCEPMRRVGLKIDRSG
jgi:hypothetical protein